LALSTRLPVLARCLAAGAAKYDLNGYSWKFPAVCTNMAYGCYSWQTIRGQISTSWPSSMYFTLKIGAYASPLAMFLSISPHIHIKAYRNIITAMTNLDRYSA